MATNITERLDYVLHIDKVHTKLLLNIWHFENLKIAIDDNEVWIKDFTLDQINSKEVKSLSPARIYYLKEARLFPKGKLLPVARMKMMPSWKPIQTVLQLKTPDLNHNYFGIPEKASFEIVKFEAEKDTCAQLIQITDFNSQIIETAASYRLEKLTYTIVAPDQLLIIGTPLLPLKGYSFWKNKSSFYPTGYYLKYPALETIVQNAIDQDQIHFIIWQKNNCYTLIEKDQFVPLTISSYRKSLKLIDNE
ncbi:hypothetical protein [Nonlabens sp. Asnod3-A02]|uniref:hypothetical protein n=1 Tax=Nonlabens sp. Asnod3-A02 TaxID=3160579 RepID=UPI0038645991